MGVGVMVLVPEKASTSDLPPLTAVICVDHDAFDRMAPVLRHLAVGLVDQAVDVRVITSDPRLESLALGPLQTLLHQPIIWPFSRQRLEAVFDALQSRPPTTVHAVSGGSYRIAREIAAVFDSDLILQATSLMDCEAAMHIENRHADAFIAMSQPLLELLERSEEAIGGRISLVRPGVLASSEIACFASSETVPAILCTSPWEPAAGVALLLQAAHLLHRQDEPFMLFLWGRGSHEGALRKFVRETRLSPRVIFADPLGDAANAMYDTDVFVNTSADSAFTVDGLQAMGAGVATVTYASTVYDYFRHGETALVCDPPTAESLAGALRTLIADRTYARTLATSARDYVRSHHSMSAMAVATAAIYRKAAMTHATFSIKKG